MALMCWGLQGMLHSRLSARVDRVVDEAQKAVLAGGKVRAVTFSANLNLNGASGFCKDVQVFLPAPDEDVILVFTHILKHFYIGGIGLRQICDWCRLLYTYKDSLDVRLLESRIKAMGLMTEWKAFGAFATKYLGMPEVSGFMFQDSSGKKWERKADRIMEFVLESGNFGHNREFKRSRNYIIKKAQAFCFKLRDFVRHARIFPLDSMKFFFHYVIDGLIVARDKETAKGRN